MRGKKITFFGLMKEKTFAKLFRSKRAIYRMVDTNAYNSVGFSSCVLQGEKITFFRVMKEKTFTKLVGGNRASYVTRLEHVADRGQ